MCGWLLSGAAGRGHGLRLAPVLVGAFVAFTLVASVPMPAGAAGAAPATNRAGAALVHFPTSPDSFVAMRADVASAMGGMIDGRAVAVDGPGYHLMRWGRRQIGMRGDYVLRLYTDRAGWYLDVVDDLDLVAAQLELATGADVTVGPPKSSVTVDTGEIIIRMATEGPCGVFAVPGYVGCGGPIIASPEATVFEGGEVWLYQALRSSDDTLDYMLLHEVGHAVGLHHFDEPYFGVHQVMSCCGSRAHYDDRYETGDVNGLRQLAANGFLDAAMPDPHAPASPLAPELGAGVEKLLVSWVLPPTYGAPIDGMQVETEMIATAKRQRWDVDGAATATTLAEVPHGEALVARVRARNAIGWGPWSAWSSPQRTLVRCSDRFTDVTTLEPYCASIAWVADQAIANGYPDGTFRPRLALTRQAFARFLRNTTVQMKGAAPLAASAEGVGFTDVSPTHPFHDDIVWLAERTVTVGYPDGTFRPDVPVTREMLATLLRRYFTTELGIDPADGLLSASDDDLEWLRVAGLAGAWCCDLAPRTTTVGRDEVAAVLERIASAPWNAAG